jgi:hypothetical protein
MRGACELTGNFLHHIGGSGWAQTKGRERIVAACLARLAGLAQVCPPQKGRANHDYYAGRKNETERRSEQNTITKRPSTPPPIIFLAIYAGRVHFFFSSPSRACRPRAASVVR